MVLFGMIWPKKSNSDPKGHTQPQNTRPKRSETRTVTSDKKSADRIALPDSASDSTINGSRLKKTFLAICSSSGYLSWKNSQRNMTKNRI